MRGVAAAGLCALFVFAAVPESRARGAESAGDAYEMPGCVLLATKKILNDLNYVDQILSNEVGHLKSDVEYLWNSLRGYSQSLNADWDAYSKKGVRDRASYEEIRGDLWGTYEAVKKLEKRMRSVSDEGRRLEREWWAIRKLSEKKARLRLARLKKRLGALARRSNSLDGDIPALQARSDESRTYYLRYINGLGAEVFDPGEVVDIPSPWHWLYRDSETPRPDMSYDFGKSYEEYLDFSHEKLHTGLKRK